MNRIKRKTSAGYIAKLILACVLTVALVLGVSMLANNKVKAADGADFTGYTAISTSDDLTKLSGSSDKFYLTNDIDMKGKTWTPIDFSGVLDGDGHAILNLTVSTVNAAPVITYDGNFKEYNTYGSGLFGNLTGATVKNLNLIGERIDVTTDANTPVYAGSVAGIMSKSTISNCNIVSYVSVTTASKNWGSAGIVGFADGMINDNTVDCTLVCIDTDENFKDEQFMGGAYCSGFADLLNNKIKIDGYDSDHGYVHDGGAVGMYMVYPKGYSYAGKINNNRVDGRITFFEDNRDRRAYCAGIVGEVLMWTYEYKGNSYEFDRNEVYDYKTILLPHSCTNPTYTTTVVAAGCESYGYTEYKCNACGNVHNEDYTSYAHTVTNWTTTKEATVDAEGIKQGSCDSCGLVVTQSIDKLEPKQEEYAMGETGAAKTKLTDSKVFIVIVIICVVIVAVVGIILLVLYRQEQARRRRRRRRRRRQ